MSVNRHISHTFLTRIQVTLLTIVQSVAFTRLLGAEGRGLYAKLQASLNLTALLLAFGISAGITNYVANRKLRAEEVFGLALWIWILGLVMMTAGLTAFFLFPSTDWIFPNGYRNTYFVIYFFMSFALTTLQLSLAAGLNGRQRFGIGNAVELGTTLLRTLIFCALLAAPEASFKLLFGLDLAMVVIKTALYAFYFFGEFGFCLWLKLSNLRRSLTLLRFSFWIYASAVIGFLYLRIDFWLIESRLGLKELGHYSVAAGLAQYMTIIPIALGTVMVPLISSLKAEESSETLKYFSRLNVSATGFCTILFMIGGTSLLKLLYGPDFANAGVVLWILAPSYFLLSVKFLFTNYNAATQRVRRNIVPELLGLAVGLTLNLILLPRIGVWGACWASLGANFIACAVVIVQVLSDSHVSSRGLILIRRQDLRELVASVWVWPTKVSRPA